VVDRLSDYGDNLRMRLLPLFASLLAGPCLSAADHDEYVPMNEGDEWTWEATTSARRGGVSTSITLHRKVGAKQERYGKMYCRLKWEMTAPTDTVEPFIPFSHFSSASFAGGGGSEISHSQFRSLCRKDETGVYSIDFLTPKPVEKPEIPLPFKVGATRTRMMRGKKMQETVLGVEKVTIKDTVYERCYHLRITGADFTEDCWEAPNVGLVKSEVVFSNGRQFSLELREFKPGRK
jgi:hypothetical protein